jgi:hypothetical protein
LASRAEATDIWQILGWAYLDQWCFLQLCLAVPENCTRCRVSAKADTLIGFKHHSDWRILYRVAESPLALAQTCGHAIALLDQQRDHLRRDQHQHGI